MKISFLYKNGTEFLISIYNNFEIKFFLPSIINIKNKKIIIMPWCWLCTICSKKIWKKLPACIHKIKEETLLSNETTFIVAHSLLRSDEKMTQKQFFYGFGCAPRTTTYNTFLLLSSFLICVCMCFGAELSSMNSDSFLYIHGILSCSMRGEQGWWHERKYHFNTHIEIFWSFL